MPPPPPNPCITHAHTHAGPPQGRAAFFNAAAERSPSPGWLKDKHGNVRDPSPPRFGARKENPNEFGAVFR